MPRIFYDGFPLWFRPKSLYSKKFATKDSLEESYKQYITTPDNNDIK